MGLDTTHDAFHGAYSSFNHFRMEICVAAGIEMVPDPERGDRPHPIWWTDMDPSTDYMGNWTAEPDDPLRYLIEHSDCDGALRCEHLPALVERLRPLSLATEQDRLDQFIRGCEDAIARGDDVGFW